MAFGIDNYIYNYLTSLVSLLQILSYHTFVRKWEMAIVRECNQLYLYLSHAMNLFFIFFVQKGFLRLIGSIIIFWFKNYMKLLLITFLEMTILDGYEIYMRPRLFYFVKCLLNINQQSANNICWFKISKTNKHLIE